MKNGLSYEMELAENTRTVLIGLEFGDANKEFLEINVSDHKLHDSDSLATNFFRPTLIVTKLLNLINLRNLAQEQETSRS